MSHNDFEPLDLMQSDKLASQALDLLRAGEVQGEFPEIAHNLSCRVGEPQAVTLGTLLMTAGDLITISSSEDAQEVSSAYRRIGPYIELAGASIKSRGLSQVGRAVLEHSLQIAPTQELRHMLGDLSRLTD